MGRNTKWIRLPSWIKKAVQRFASEPHRSGAILLREFLIPWRYSSLLMVAEPVLSGVMFCLAFEFFSHWIAEAHRTSVAPLLLLRGLALWGFIFTLLWSGREALKSFAHHFWRLRVEGTLRRKILHVLHQIPLEWLEGNHRGVWVPRIRADLAATETFLVDSFPQQTRAAVFLCVIFIYGFFQFGLQTFLLVPLVACVLTIGYFHYHRLVPLQREVRLAQGASLNLLLESLEGTRTLRTHGAEPYIHRRFDDLQSRLMERSLLAARQGAAWMGAQEALLRGSAVALSLLGVSALLSSATNSSVISLAVLFAVFLVQSRDGFFALGRFLVEWKSFTRDSRRIFDLLHRPLEPVQRLVRFGVEPRQVERLLISGLVVSNAEGQLGPMDLSVPRGQLWAISGPSSSGKTALLEVIAGLRAGVTGGIQLNDKLDRTLWSSLGKAPQIPLGVCAFVEQQPYLLEASLRENLTFGNQERLSDALLWQALESLGLYETARALGGLDGILRARGEGLTHGERYRVALCRALLLRRSFLLVDEPFGKLDDRTVDMVIQVLNREKAAGSGVLIATRYLPGELALDGRIQVHDLTVPVPQRIRPGSRSVSLPI